MGEYERNALIDTACADLQDIMGRLLTDDDRRIPDDELGYLARQIAETHRFWSRWFTGEGATNAK